MSENDDLEIPASLRRDPKTNLRPGQKPKAPEAPKAAAPTPPKAPTAKPAAPKVAPKAPAAKPAAPKAAAKKPAAKAPPLPKKGGKTPEEIANAAAEKARKEALAAAEKQAKERAEADKKAAANRGLEDKAKEIFVRVEKANKLEGQADDHRVAIALQLAAAKEDCKVLGVKFEKWCDDNFAKINLGYEQARKLAACGVSGKQEDTLLAITDMRTKGKQRAAKKREGDKAKKPAAKKPSEPKRHSPNAEIQLSPEADEIRKLMGAQFDALSGSDQENFVQWLAESIGATVTFAS